MKEYGYGFFPGGDPRDFKPDVECCTEQEIANHKAACEAWDRGERPVADIGGFSGNVHVLKAPFGLGTYSFEIDDDDEEAEDDAA